MTESVYYEVSKYYETKSVYVFKFLQKMMIFGTLPLPNYVLISFQLGFFVGERGGKDGPRKPTTLPKENTEGGKNFQILLGEMANKIPAQGSK